MRSPWTVTPPLRNFSLLGRPLDSKFCGWGTKREKKKIKNPGKPRRRGRENVDTRVHTHALTRRPSGRTLLAHKLEVGATPEAFPLTAGGGGDEFVKLSHFPLF